MRRSTSGLLTIIGLALGSALAIACDRSDTQTPPRDALSSDLPANASDIRALLSKVPDGASWQTLSPELRASFTAHAANVLQKDREAWGPSGLAEKERILIERPTPAMRDNIDRVLSVDYASELPNGFKLERDVTNPELKRLLIRLYLIRVDERAYLLFDHPEFRAWDGNPVKELQLLDDQHTATMAALRCESLRRNPPACGLSTIFRMRGGGRFGHTRGFTSKTRTR